MKSVDIASLARPAVLKLRPYSSARDEFPGPARIYLDANESPFPAQFNRYPDPHQNELKNLLSRIKGSNVNQIFLGNGSDEIIDLLIRAFCEPAKDRIIVCEPTYGMYRVCAGVNMVEVVNVPLTPTFQLNSSALREAFSRPTKLLFLCSPNNPTGNNLDEGSISSILDAFEGLTIIDEAYIDFSNARSWITLLQEFPNLVILQTLSKAWGLAGIRLGMAFANPEIVALLDKIKPPYNISSPSQQIAISTLQDYNLTRVVDAVRAQRHWLSNQLFLLPGVTRVYPSEANFLLVQFRDSSPVFTRLQNAGIIVRDRSRALHCDNCLRITIGTQQENEELIDVLRKI